MKSKNNNLEKNKLNALDLNQNPKSQKTTINTIENQKRSPKSPEQFTKKISKKKIRRKIFQK